MRSVEARESAPASSPSAALEGVDGQFRADWVVSTAFGLSCASMVAAFAVHGLRAFAGTAPASWITAGTTIAACSGAVLGGCQARVLRRRFTRALAIRWVAASAGPIALVCAAASLLASGMNSASIEPPFAARLGWTLVAGGGFGLTLGTAQTFAVRRYVRHSRGLALASALGWFGASPLILLGAMLCQLDRAWWEELVFAAATGLLAGEVLGATTAVAIGAFEPRATR